MMPSPPPVPPAPSTTQQAAEQQRQSALLAAILSFELSPTSSNWLAPHANMPPLRPYQGHVRVLAAQVLAQAYPTLKALLGDAPWPHAAQAFWQQHPPTHGPLHLWGQAFAHWVAEQNEWQAWPFLADMARLDWALHESLLADQVGFDSASLACLSHAEAHQLLLRLKPGLHVIHSPWPVMSLYLAHQTDDAEAHWLAAQSAIGAQLGQCVCVCQGTVHDLPPNWLGWMAALSHSSATSTTCAAPTLGALLDQFANTLDFTEWLTTAVSKGWLWRIEPVNGA